MPPITIRRLHRFIGLVMLLPFVGWAATGIVFFTKPGYGAAYDALAVKTYPLDGPFTLQPDPAWREVRYLRTTLGTHLIARTTSGWAQLDPVTHQPAAPPAPDDVKRLIADAFTANPARYGSTTSSIKVGRPVGSGCAVGDEAKFENSVEICRSSLTCARIELTHSSSTGDSGRPESRLIRRACSAES